MTWDALAHWGDVRVVGELAGGARNELRLVEVDGRRAVARLGCRSAADLDWEIALLDHLGRSGFGVPRVIAALDGRRHVDALCVMSYVSGREPDSSADWRRVAEYLSAVHGATAGWQQRPGWASSIDLLARDSATSVDLTAMPADAVARCRRAWARLRDREPVVVHGDPNPGNIRIEGDRVILIDWDEARVDVALLDLVLPYNAANLTDDDLQIASQAASAWEAAVCWAAEPTYARRRLDEVTDGD